ncbi:MBOAT family O-acyltransferase [Propionivibrio soli]|uniref:MBOAT family O-acyltransferase n=1 Tax=Propionivibrio soli TaxID=2976531 RepID=UPI0021E74B62|nr:MBOAT family protein [Propionivibrio soli]
MLFTSAAFFCVYLPVVFAGYYVLGGRWPLAAAAWLFGASVAFYGYWMPEFTLLLLGSIVWNFVVGKHIGTLDPLGGDERKRRRAKRWLIIGVTGDLVVLAYFKYAGFFIANLNALLDQTWSLGNIVLPIGISFFTFTQIAFLADSYLKGTREYRFVHFGLFVTYFPHLIAGPVLHHAQMMPQFKEVATYRLNVANVAAGMAIFAIGLSKKVVFADGVSPYADAVFNAAALGQHPHLVEAWMGALAYTFQLYFDFSGYSDMAIGLSWMFNVKLPYNFNSPYKALNISDFWRRWHMTLSAFLRDYLYIPLGGNQKGPRRRYINLMVTMVLGGLWHGASWTFVFWGTLHGIYLVINHAFQKLVNNFYDLNGPAFKLVAWAMTFLSAVVAWVFFRAPDFPTALRVLNGMVTPSTVTGEMFPPVILGNRGLDVGRGAVWLVALAGISFLMPNSNRIGEALLAHCRKGGRFVAIALGATLVSSAFLVLVNAARDSVSAFIYFNF